jgi:hypothetical protein
MPKLIEMVRLIPDVNVVPLSLWQRLLGRPASESGTLRHGDGTHGRSDRCRRVRRDLNQRRSLKFGQRLLPPTSRYQIAFAVGTGTHVLDQD